MRHSQTFDEARHVEAFNKYLQTRIQRTCTLGRALKGLLDKILTDPLGLKIYWYASCYRRISTCMAC